MDRLVPSEPESRRRRVVLGLPAFNEEDGLGALLEDVAMIAPSVPGIEILVVDDGSTDRTGRVARTYTGPLAVRLVTHPRNLGLGAALRTILKEFAVMATHEDDVLLTMDSDNSHPPSLIPNMLAVLDIGKDVVIASRFVPGAAVRGLKWQRRALSSALRWIARLLFPIRGVRDYSSGYRGYRAAYLLPILRRQGVDALIRENDFSAMPALLLRLWLADRRMRVAEVPLCLRYDLKASASKMRVIRNVCAVMRLLLGQSARRALSCLARSCRR